MLFPRGYRIETNLSKLTAQFTQTIFDEIGFSLNLIFKKTIWSRFSSLQNKATQTVSSAIVCIFDSVPHFLVEIHHSSSY